MLDQLHFKRRLADATASGHARCMNIEMSARRPHVALRDTIDMMLSEQGILSEVEFSPLVMASAEHNAHDIKSVSDDFFTEVRRQPWIERVETLYVGCTDNPTFRWRNELLREFQGMQIVRATVVVAAGRDLWFGKTPPTTMEGIITEAASATLSGLGIKIINSRAKCGAGADRLVESVHRVESWEKGGKAEFESFAEHTREKLCSRGLGTGTKALLSKLLWQDAGAKHAYVVFLGAKGPGDKTNRADVTHDSHEDVDDEEGSDGDWAVMFPPITQGGGAGGVAAGCSSGVRKRHRDGGGK